MFYSSIIKEFDEKITLLEKGNDSTLFRAEKGIDTASKTLTRLKEGLIKFGVRSAQEEIRFFKIIKVRPMRYLIYYTEVRSSELRIPKWGCVKQLDFLEEQIKKVNQFFSRHTDFLLYMEQGYTHFDEHYFTREYLNRNPVVKSYPYYKDPVFNTSHDEIWARIKGLAMYANYLKIKSLEIKNCCKTNRAVTQKELLWTGSYAAFVELVYGLQAMGYINKGNVDIKKIVDLLGDFLDVPKGNHSRTYNELKSRKGSQIKFFQETGRKLLEKMDEEDGLDE
ncbi:RteC domain-containing protein [Muricauda ruestringensis]|uniref:RteC domain-containing protein n=1 Tax=Flagellimonas aurea TaxID=2915619 RepID=A0ABS3G9C9_9FLAO|nr:RteC domain-containing protein [Allomuricauda aurea]MBO0356029.1 RteC domain-containing protein [Allomuricauda aurea]